MRKNRILLTALACGAEVVFIFEQKDGLTTGRQV
jgi:hypothetical protein